MGLIQKWHNRKLNWILITPLTPNILKDHLQINMQEQTQNYSITTLNNNNRVSIKLLNFKAEDKDYTGTVVVTKGMVPQGGKNGTEEN